MSLNKIKSLLKTFKDVSEGIINGEQVLATKEVCCNREKICSNCPKLVKLASLDQCSECGCLIKSKVQLNSAKCPINKW